MPRRTQVFQQLPWTGGLNTTVDPGLLPPTDLVTAKNVVFALSGARIKRNAHNYFDVSPTTISATTHESATTNRKLMFVDADDVPVTINNATREYYTVGEYISVTSNEAAFNTVYGTASAKITAISNDTIEYALAGSASTPTTTSGLVITVAKLDPYIATEDFWYFDNSTNAKVQEQIVLQKNQDDDIIMYTHDSSASANRRQIVARSSQITTVTFDTATDVTAETDQIAQTAHGLVTGDRLIYNNGGGTTPAGLISTSTYYVIKISAGAIQLAATYLDARNGKAVDITAIGSGSAHTLTADTTDQTWTAVSGELRVTFLAINERLIIAFDQVGVVPRIYEPTLDSYRLLEGGAPDFFTMTTHFNRVFANDKLNPDRVHYSETGDPDVWGGISDSGAIDIFPGDGDAIGVSAIFPPFKGRLFITKKSKTYQLVGSSPEDFQPIIVSEGLGCEGPLSIAKVDLDDIVYVSDKGFHSLAATTSFGDFEGAFLSKKIQSIFDDDLNRTRLKYIKGVYIPTINSIAFSVARLTSDTVETALLLYNVELKEWYEWPDLVVNGMSVRRVGNTRKIVYVTSASRLVETQTVGFTDFGSTAIRYVIKSGTIYPAGNPKSYVGFKKITFYYKPVGRFSFTATLKIDNQEVQSLSFAQTSDGDSLGVDFILGQSTLGSNNVLAPFTRTIDGYGRGCTISIEQTGTDEQIEIYGFDIEYEDADIRQETNQTGDTN